MPISRVWQSQGWVTGTYRLGTIVMWPNDDGYEIRVVSYMDAH